MEDFVKPSTGLTRKKIKTPENWKRNKLKTARLVLGYYLVAGSKYSCCV